MFWSGFGADFVRALSSPGKALPGEDKAHTKSAPKPLQNTLHGKRALSRLSMERVLDALLLAALLFAARVNKSSADKPFP